LVVGVGTGLELELLPEHPRVTGVDVSVPMLQIARQRVKRKNLANVKALLAMDAGAMTFEPGRFDCVLAPYVMSVVPDPQLVLDQIWRVLRPGGELVIVSHFWAETGPRAWVESWLDSWASWLGWRPAFPFAAIGDWVSQHPDALWRDRRKVAPMKLFTLLRIGKRA
jgi:phosphatidylethanolamine/phosphatidyl-N-methylethanolamine N-methyltransferase